MTIVRIVTFLSLVLIYRSVYAAVITFDDSISMQAPAGFILLEGVYISYPTKRFYLPKNEDGGWPAYPVIYVQVIDSNNAETMREKLVSTPTHIFYSTPRDVEIDGLPAKEFAFRVQITASNGASYSDASHEVEEFHGTWEIITYYTIFAVDNVTYTCAYDAQKDPDRWLKTYREFCKSIKVLPNKRMQSDQNARYAPILAADAGRYAA